MLSDPRIVALILLIIGVAVFVTAILGLIRVMQGPRRKDDAYPFGDVPEVPEFIKRKRNDQ